MANTVRPRPLETVQWTKNLKDHLVISEYSLGNEMWLSKYYFLGDCSICPYVDKSKNYGSCEGSYMFINRFYLAEQQGLFNKIPALVAIYVCVEKTTTRSVLAANGCKH